MKKRALTLLLAAALLLPSLAACSESGTNTETPASAADGAGTTVTTPEAQEEEPEIGLDTAKLQYADRNYDVYAYRIADRASRTR